MRGWLAAREGSGEGSAGVSLTRHHLDHVGLGDRGKRDRGDVVDEVNAVKEACVAQPKVGQLDVATLVDQDVVGLNVAVHYGLCGRPRGGGAGSG